MKLLSDRVAVLRDEPENKTPGGIVLTTEDTPLTGIVCYVGPGQMTDDGELLPMTLQVGDNVLIGKFNGVEIEVGGVEYVILRESDIMAVIE